MKRLLNGLTVLSFEQAVAAPFCTAKIADQGARVIKVERPAVGDFARKYDKNCAGSSSYFTWLNRGKESLAVDIKDESYKRMLKNLIASGQVDIFVQNLAPGAAQRAGFGSEELRKLNDRLITLDISGYGETGPRSHYKAYDLLVAAEAGLCAVTGSPDEPGRVGVSICDIAAGMNGYAAILQGLYEREKTGKGSGYKVSLFDTVAEVMNVPLIQQMYTGEAPKRVGLRHPSIAPYGAFETKDKRNILISIQNEREWVKLCEDVLNDPQLATNKQFDTATNRVANRTALDSTIQACFSGFLADDLIQRLLDSGVAFGELNSVEGLQQHPHLRKLEYKTEDGTPVAVAAPAVIPSPEYVGDVPALGQHNEKILHEFRHLID